MRLPDHYKIESLAELRKQIQERINIATEDDDLEMSKEQYLAYKELVWRWWRELDPIMRFDGRRIKLSTPQKSQEGGGSV